jgi:hypothetical protein
MRRKLVGILIKSSCFGHLELCHNDMPYYLQTAVMGYRCPSLEINKGTFIDFHQQFSVGQEHSELFISSCFKHGIDTK